MVISFMFKETEADRSPTSWGLCNEGKVERCSGPKSHPACPLVALVEPSQSRMLFPACKTARSLCASWQAAAFEQLVLIM